MPLSMTGGVLFRIPNSTRDSSTTPFAMKRGGVEGSGYVEVDFPGWGIASVAQQPKSRPITMMDTKGSSHDMT